MIKLNAENIGNAQIAEFQASISRDHFAYQWCLDANDTRNPRRRMNARGQIAQIINERAADARANCRGRGHANHIGDVCDGSCCTECGGPIDSNEECRC